MGRSMEALITQLQDDPEILRELRDQLIAHPDVLRQMLAALREQGRAGHVIRTLPAWNRWTPGLTPDPVAPLFDLEIAETLTLQVGDLHYA